MNWKLKGSIQKALSCAPGGTACNHLLQRTVGTLSHLEEHVASIYHNDVTVIFEKISTIGLDVAKGKIMEIGTGWLPVIPFSLALAGFKDILTIDIYRHLSLALAKRTLLAMEPLLDHPSLRRFSGSADIHDRFKRIKNSAKLLDGANITYQAPTDAGKTNLRDGALSLIISNNVFEHVPTAGLNQIMSESKRLLRVGGHSVHCVNCGDHYAYADPSVTQLNYLQYSESEWKRWNNRLQYQNRLRPIDFIELAEVSGFKVKQAQYQPREDYLKVLDSMTIAPEFMGYSKEQLASTSLTLIAER